MEVCVWVRKLDGKYDPASKTNAHYPFGRMVIWQEEK